MRAAVVALAVLAASCGASTTADSPTSPAPVLESSATAIASTTGHVQDVLSSAAVAGVGFTGDRIVFSTSDASGAFTLGVTFGSGATLVSLQAPSIVYRQTYVTIPGPDTTITVIPASFDLVGFNQMFRQTQQLVRWTTAPPLVIERRLLQFASTTATQATALSTVMSSADTSTLTGDLTWALPQLTGNTFTAFASVRDQTGDNGSSISMLNTGQITVARYQDLTSMTGYWGYSRWQYLSDGTVVAGLIMLDATFDQSGSVFRRSLRSHELGHALGYNHVEGRQSVMNQNAQLEPNAFDRQGAIVAFHRPPGNRSPDIDPPTLSTGRVLQAIWSAPIH